MRRAAAVSVACCLAAIAVSVRLARFLQALRAQLRETKAALKQECVKRASDRTGRIRAEQEVLRLQLHLANQTRNQEPATQAPGSKAYNEGSSSTDTEGSSSSRLGGPPVLPVGYFMKPIGHIQSCFSQRNGTPRQPQLVPAARCRLLLAPDIPADCLEGLADYSHVWLLFVFHRNTDLAKSLGSQPQTQHPSHPSKAAARGGQGSSHTPMQAGVPGGQARGGCRPGLKAKVAVPRLNGGRLGVLATRSPHRPCPIGLSVAKVIAVEGRSVLLGGTDLVDGSPVLDLKPYVFCDAVPDACAPAWVKAEAEDEPLLVAAVEVDSLAAQALREGWQGRATRQPPPLTASADAFLDLVSQVLARDIRSLHQRLHAPPPSSRPPLPSGGSAEKPGATVTTQQPPAGNAEPRCEADGPEFADPINPASDAPRPTEEFTGAVDPMGFYRVVLDGIEVSYDMDQSGKVQVRGARTHRS
ncbi:TsaA-like domain-containing protein [Haematococcus lacustris]